jgi:hypothetical protein
VNNIGGRGVQDEGGVPGQFQEKKKRDVNKEERRSCVENEQMTPAFLAHVTIYIYNLTYTI